ncbi:LysR family transcriptional regulator [uncultured Maritimibacter sp.]|uniref:LysR family transcriptional regulator n=1 Tax=uncultured Maritimibacter sp. TaxID=991866 RepID=UPI0025994A47|nr:LysR family transcriptional regulator [uncultured Maritimibacter sp.]
MRNRRFLPSISVLSAFDAVIATGSVTAAARELDLTQSTVSRLIRTLEEQLGRDLFVRHKKRLVPTPAALDLAGDVGRALDLIQRASMKVVANPDGGSLSVATLPTLNAQWLGPRLKSFLDTNPGINLSLTTRLRRFSFETEPVDAVIYFGDDDWPGAHHLRLFGEHYTACAAPNLIAGADVTAPADLARLPLLQLETRPLAWADWFAAHDAPPPRADGMLFDHFSMMTQAAIAGLGVAILPAYLAATERSEGRLEPLFTPAVRGRGAYWLAWPEPRDAYPPLVAFRDWLAGQPAP